MRNELFCLFWGFLLMANVAFGQKPVATPAQPSARRPPSSWQENQEMPLSFAAAKVRVKTKYEAQGFSLKHEIALGKRNEGCLLLWEKEGKKVLVMLRRLDVDRTCVSYGEIKDDGK
ncbi:MAG: hypothetical protein GX574_13970 [Lentisphaerae bacterium]|nr:hypothetical protein [Lentisphaerota bacterium]HQL86322.1 hypothetical protein [Lentisphaeria bacterium]